LYLPIILAVCIALFVAGRLDGPAGDLPHWQQMLGFLVGPMFIGWALMRWTSQRLLKRLLRMGWRHRSVRRRPARVELLMRTMVLGLFTLQLTEGKWATLVCQQWGLERPSMVLVGEVSLLAPFVVLDLMKCWCFYPVNRFVREQLVVEQLAEGLAARPVWTRRQYLLFHVRHGLLIILAPLLLIFGLRDVVELALSRFSGVAQAAAPVTLVGEVVTGLGTVLIFVCSPLLLRRIWVTRSLPAGPLRSKLESFCQVIKLNYRDILLWDTYSAVGNAAVMGVFRAVRFILLSDNLIENMPDEQIEGVFAHEAGHVKHHHVLFFVLFVLAGGLLVTAFWELLARLIDILLPAHAWIATYQQWLTVSAAVLMGMGCVALFGWVSRRFERQADVHAAIALAQAHNHRNNPAQPDQQAPPGQNTGPNPSLARQTLSAYGASVMAEALKRIALLNGISLRTRSWRHSSIASRAAFLYYLVRHPGALNRFKRSVQLIKLMIVVGLAVGALLLYILSSAQETVILQP